MVIIVIAIDGSVGRFPIAIIFITFGTIGVYSSRQQANEKILHKFLSYKGIDFEKLFVHLLLVKSLEVAVMAAVFV